MTAVTEGQFQEDVILLARRLTVLAYHTYDSRRASAGFPDLVLAGRHGLIFAELKTEGGHLSGRQRNWKWMLTAAGADWQLWRPADWLSGRIETEIRRIA